MPQTPPQTDTYNTALDIFDRTHPLRVDVDENLKIAGTVITVPSGVQAVSQSGVWTVNLATEPTIDIGKVDQGTGGTSPWLVQPSFASNQIDLFGRQRVGSPDSIFNAVFLYDKQPLFWDEALTGTGTSTFITNQSSIALAVTATSGDRVIRQTKEYFTYEPGRAQLGQFTGVFGTPRTNCKQMIGLFDDNDGCFFQMNGSTFGVTIRSSTSGAPVDTTVIQANFNLDKLDGTGPSGLVIDLTKTQIFVVEYQWFGVGTVRFGVFSNNQTIYCHQIFHANLASIVYMRRGSLPIRYEIVNNGATTGSVSLLQICCTVFSEAGYSPVGSKRAVDTGTTFRTVAGLNSAPLLSIRLKAANNRATVVPESFSILLGAADNSRFQIVLNGALTGATFANSVSNSVVEYDTAATAMSGGTIISSGYISNQIRSVVAQDINSLLKVVANIAGTSDTLTLYVSNITSGVSYAASLEWEEFI